MAEPRHCRRGHQWVAGAARSGQRWPVQHGLRRPLGHDAPRAGPTGDEVGSSEAMGGAGGGRAGQGAADACRSESNGPGTMEACGGDGARPGPVAPWGDGAQTPACGGDGARAGLGGAGGRRGTDACVRGLRGEEACRGAGPGPPALGAKRVEVESTAPGCSRSGERVRTRD
nr:uncharacterized PE-PGRS family protein PE_PGRS54-like [Aegilops tauschii subsp. strangulata]